MRRTNTRPGDNNEQGHQNKHRPPLTDMTNTRPTRHRKPSTRILFLKGEQQDTTKPNNTDLTTSTPLKQTRKPNKQLKQNDDSTTATTSRTRSKSVTAGDETATNKPIKTNKKPGKKLTTIKETDSSLRVEEIPSRSVKFQSDVADETESQTPVKKRTRSTRTAEKNVKTIRRADSPAKTTERSLDVSVESKPEKIPIYRRIKALNTPSPSVNKTEKLYEFDFDPKIEPAKPIKKRNVKKTDKTSAPKRKKKNLDLNQSEDMAKLIKELKKIRAATKAKQKRALLLPPPPLVPRTVSPIRVENVSGPKSNETSHTTMEIEDLGTSMFNEPPIANSSMIRPFQSPGRTARTPASPWRVQCNDVNKWPKNFYVKPSMTPAYDRDTSHTFNLDNPGVRVDCSSAADQSHVEKHPVDPKDYTLYKGDVSDWRQTSILSFYEKAMNKSPRKRGRSPKKPDKPIEKQSNEDFLDLPPEVIVDLAESPEMTSENPPAAVVENFFGFDESPEFDQENVSPKKLPKIKSVKEVLVRTKKQFGNILKEINQKTNAPMRVSPKKVMTLRNAQKKQMEKEISTNLFINDQPVECIENNENNTASNETAQTSAEIRLFENPADIEAVSFNKASRRSYERKRRPPVKFKSAVEIIAPQDISDVGSDSDESVQLNIKKKTMKRKQNAPSKKEEKEANEWAAEFNSLLEEADDFALCVE